jgi:methyl coenzyme M reductase alpha subunit
MNSQKIQAVKSQLGAVATGFRIGNYLDKANNVRPTVKVPGARKDISVETALVIVENFDAFFQAIEESVATSKLPETKAALLAAKSGAASATTTESAAERIARLKAKVS